MHPHRARASLPSPLSTGYWHDAGRMRETIARRKATRIRHQRHVHGIDDDKCGCSGGCLGRMATVCIHCTLTMMLKMMTTILVRLTVAPEMAPPHVKVSTGRQSGPTARLRLLALYAICYLIINRSGVGTTEVTTTAPAPATTPTTITTLTPASDAMKHEHPMVEQHPRTVNRTVVAGPTDHRVDVQTDGIGQLRMSADQRAGPSNQLLSANQVSAAAVTAAVHLKSVQPDMQHHQQQKQQQQAPVGGVAGDAEDYYFDDDDDTNSEYINLIANKSGECGWRVLVCSRGFRIDTSLESVSSWNGIPCY